MNSAQTIVRSGTMVQRTRGSVAAAATKSSDSLEPASSIQYRAACRGRSKAEFRAKIGTVVEEADESIYWLELIIEGELLEKSKVEPLLAEANELCAIMVASRKSSE